MNNKNRQSARNGGWPGWGRNIIFGMAFALGVAGVMTSCMHDAALPCPDVNPEGEYVLDLKVVVEGLASRSSVHKETFSGESYESFINIGGEDYAVFILDGNTGMFVQRVEPGAVSMERDVSDNLIYHINGSFKPKKALEKIRVMVAANWRTAFSGNYLAFEEAINDKSLDDIYATGANPFNYTLPVRKEAEVTCSWQPGNESGIAMFGLSDPVSLDRTLIEITNPIPALRAVAKIEIVDMVPDGISANIKKCVLTRYNTTGRFIPDGRADANPNWNVENTQVERPSLPEDITVSEDLQFVKTVRKVRPAGAKDDVDKDCFVVYIPEMAMGTESRPELEIYVEGIEKPYTIQLADYKYDEDKGQSVQGDTYTSILRNHIYRYNVLSVGVKTDLTILIETPFWTETPDQNWTYTDAEATFDEDGGFRWTDPKWDDSNVYDDLERILIVTDRDAAEGSFTLTGPADGSWTLSLFADDDTRNDHFRIDLWNGNDWDSCDDTVTRKIDGKPVRFRIIATAPNGTETDYTARVVMTVRTFDDRVVNVKLTKNNETDPAKEKYYYTVKQVTNGGDNM